MTISIKFKTLFLSLFSLLLLTSCSKEEESTYLENSLVNVRLVGTETQLNRLNLEVIQVQLKVLEDETAPDAWISLSTVNSGILDLTNYNGNRVITLVDFEQVPAKYIHSIKLVLGDQNSVVKNNIEYTIGMNSDTALENTLEKQFVENMLYEFTIELDIDESIDFSIQGDVQLNPKTNTELRLYNLF